METHDADIVHSYKWIVPDNPEFTLSEGVTGKVQSTPSTPVSPDLKKRIWEQLCLHAMHSVTWLCLYKAKLFNEDGAKIRFPNCLAEDVFVHLDLLCKTEKILKVDKPFYIYRTHANSVTHSAKHLVKATDSIFRLNAYIREKLNPLTDDKNFIDKVIISIMEGVGAVYLQGAYQRNQRGTLEEIYPALEKHFGEHARAAFDLLVVWMWGHKKNLETYSLKRELRKTVESLPDQDVKI